MTKIDFFFSWARFVDRKLDSELEEAGGGLLYLLLGKYPLLLPAGGCLVICLGCGQSMAHVGAEEYVKSK